MTMCKIQHNFLIFIQHMINNQNHLNKQINYMHTLLNHFIKVKNNIYYLYYYQSIICNFNKRYYHPQILIQYIYYFNTEFCLINLEYFLLYLWNIIKLNMNMDKIMNTLYFKPSVYININKQDYHSITNLNLGDFKLI